MDFLWVDFPHCVLLDASSCHFFCFFFIDLQYLGRFSSCKNDDDDDAWQITALFTTADNSDPSSTDDTLPSNQSHCHCHHCVCIIKWRANLYYFNDIWNIDPITASSSIGHDFLYIKCAKIVENGDYYKTMPVVWSPIVKKKDTMNCGHQLFMCAPTINGLSVAMITQKSSLSLQDAEYSNIALSESFILT